MEMTHILKKSDAILKYVLIAILLLSFLMYMFVFLINWEDWFFGVKLNGAPAGMYLLLKGTGAGSLAFILMKCRRYTLAAAVLAAFYFGYTLVDSAITIQTRTDNLYSPFMLVLFAISFVFLIIHILTVRFCKSDPDLTVSESVTDSDSTTTETQKTDENNVVIIALLIIAVFITGLFIMPLVWALLFWLLGLLLG